MDYHHYMLDLFDQFQAHQESLDATSLLRMEPVGPHWTINAYANDEHKWEDWAYDEDELKSLVSLSQKQGLRLVIKKHS